MLRTIKSRKLITMLNFILKLGRWTHILNSIGLLQLILTLFLIAVNHKGIRLFAMHEFLKHSSLLLTILADKSTRIVA